MKKSIPKESWPMKDKSADIGSPMQKNNNDKHSKRKKRIMVAIIVSIVVIIGITGGIIFYVQKKKGSGQWPNQGFGTNRDLLSVPGMTEDMVMASGIVNSGVTAEEFSVENLNASLEIEEIYVASGDEIEAGEKVLKLSEEDVEEARDELNKTLREAELAYRTGTIEYEQKKITLAYDRDMALLKGKQAKEVYDETISGLDNAVQRAQDELDDTNEKIAEYASYVNEGTYREYFKVDEYQEMYDKNLKIIEDKLEEQGVEWSEIIRGVTPLRQNSTTHEQWVYLLSSLYKVLEQNLKDLEQAQSDYEEALSNASFELQTLQLKLPSLELALTESKQNYETSVQQAKLTYETSLANAKRAESDYNTAIQKAESDYNTLQKAYEDASENYMLFEKLVGDGYFYAQGSGTILRTMVRTGQMLAAEGTVFVYSNSEEMTVTVSVDQTDIAKVSLGEPAVVVTSENDYLSASVTEINPVSTSTGRSSVQYSVVLSLTGDISGASANDSVSVAIGMDVSQVENMGKQNSGNGDPQGKGMNPEKSMNPDKSMNPEKSKNPDRKAEN